MFKEVVLLLFVSLIYYTNAAIDARNLKCLVCRTTFDEFNKVVMAIDKNKQVDVGSFRMDVKGNTIHQRVPAHRSEMHLSELLETVCSKMDDYVRVYYKATGKLGLIQLMVNGAMNPDASKIRFVTDDDLNKSLEYYCERMFEENEEAILKLYKTRPEDDVMPDSEKEICYAHANYCEDWMLPTDEDTTWTREMEIEYQKVFGPDPYGFNVPPPGEKLPGMNDEDIEETEDQPPTFSDEL